MSPGLALCLAPDGDFGIARAGRFVGAGFVRSGTHWPGWAGLLDIQILQHVAQSG